MLLASAGGPTFQVSGWIASVGTVAFVVGSLLVIVRSPLARPVRWLYRTLVGQPVTAFFGQLVGDVVESHTAPLRFQLSPNGGSSVLDKVDKLVRSADDSNARLVKIEEERVKQVPMFLSDHESLAELHAKVDRLEVYAHEQNHKRINEIATLGLAREVLAKVPNANPTP